MGLGGFYTAVKYLLFAFNFIFWLLGCTILGVGIWVRSDRELANYIEGSSAFSTVYIGSYILMGVGLVIMIIGFLGCCGAMRESQCLLALFFISLLLIFVTLLAFGLYATFTRDEMRSNFEKYLKTKVDESVDESNKEYEKSKKLMDGLQNKLACCGATQNASQDYGTKVPDSCSGHRQTSCTDSLFDFVERYIIVIAGVAVGIGVVMLLGMIFSCVLFCGIRLEERNEDFRYKY